MELKDLLGDSLQFDNSRRRVWDAIANDILDEVTLGLCFEMHRSCKRGTLFLDEMDDESQGQYEIVNARGVDVFGQMLTSKKQYDCQCPNCHRNLAASRFAPHLEKCLGMGGSVSRVARRRPANSGKKPSDIESEDNSNDNDWSYNPSRKVKKLKKSTSPSKKKAPHKPGMKSPPVLLDQSLMNSPSSSQSSIYDSLPLDDRKQLLNRMCGVISEHTRKMCTRSIKCPQHTDEQRQTVRSILLSSVSDSGNNQLVDSDGMKTPSRLYMPLDLMPRPSPADSCSTATSSSSRKANKVWGKKSKKKKKKTPKLVMSTPPRLGISPRHGDQVIMKHAFDSSSSSSYLS